MLHVTFTAFLLHDFWFLVQVVATVTALVNDKNKIYEVVDHVKLHLDRFEGVSRRFEMIGKIYGCHIYDDYAHHPTEIRAVLQAARQKFYSHALWVVFQEFQPHTFRSFQLTQKCGCIRILCIIGTKVTHPNMFISL